MPLYDKALHIVQRLREAGHEAYLAGGCVRDRLLDRSPKDYDVATGATPKDVQAIFPDTVPVGSRFGSVVVVVERDPFEVTTFRSDGPYSDGRRPVHVRYGTLEEDVRRRDFTINAMMYDPVDDRVIDLVNGREDLGQGLVRAIGDADERFAEDRLRMVRAVRLACGLGFTIDGPTLRAIRNHAAAVTQVAWERIGAEITRTLTEGGARRGIRAAGRDRAPGGDPARDRGHEGVRADAGPSPRRETSSSTPCCCSSTWTPPPRPSPTAACCTTWQSRRAGSPRASG